MPAASRRVQIHVIHTAAHLVDFIHGQFVNDEPEAKKRKKKPQNKTKQNTYLFVSEQIQILNYTLSTHQSTGSPASSLQETPAATGNKKTTIIWAHNPMSMGNVGFGTVWQQGKKEKSLFHGWTWRSCKTGSHEVWSHDGAYRGKEVIFKGLLHIPEPSSHHNLLVLF